MHERALMRSMLTETIKSVLDREGEVLQYVSKSCIIHTRISVIGTAGKVALTERRVQLCRSWYIKSRAASVFQGFVRVNVICRPCEKWAGSEHLTTKCSLEVMIIVFFASADLHLLSG